MCGIGYWFSKNKAVDQSHFDLFMKAIDHRGPDHQGKVIISEHEIIANNRLAIIDIHKRSNQPFRYDDLIISFNGAIYNFRELKKDLKELGHSFVTESDTELILHAYAEYGEACVNLFNGMWAFIIVDLKKQQVFCSRDRFGIKPIYYYEQNGELIIGSEINQFKYIKKSLTISEQAVQYYLESGGFKNHNNTTFINDIYQIEPGHNLMFKINSGTKEITKYYNLVEVEESDKKSIVDLIDVCVKRRMIADVEPGVMFSGGLDSSIILAHLLRVNPKTSSYSFVDEVDPSMDERPFIHSFLEKYPHINHQVTFPSDFEALLEECIDMQGEPPASLSAVAQFLVYKLARNNGEKLMLSGQGADEIFGGYNRNLSLINPFFFLTNPFAAIEYISDNFDLIKSKFKRKTKQETIFDESVFESPKISSIKDYMHYLMFDNGLRDLLHYEDRNSMANSIETRLPFLDHELVEQAMHLPDLVKMQKFKRKGILLSTYKKILPSQILSRKNKMAFESPEKRLLESGYLDADKEYKEIKKNFPILKWNSQFLPNGEENMMFIWQIKFLNIFVKNWYKGF